jgi:hypothetical protein
MYFIRDVGHRLVQFRVNILQILVVLIGHTGARLMVRVILVAHRTATHRTFEAHRD